MMEGLDMVKAGVIIKHDQRLSDGSYEGWFNKDAAAIDWSKSVGDVYNLIRAANPAPGAWTLVNGEEIQIYDTVRIDGDGSNHGEVVAVSDDGVTIQGNGGCIVVKRVRPAKAGKISAAEWVASAKIKAGTKLG
jgi:methionyl-tRNA formyltransferase